jgi:hypothetical protein
MGEHFRNFSKTIRVTLSALSSIFCTKSNLIVETWDIVAEEKRKTEN